MVDGEYVTVREFKEYIEQRDKEDNNYKLQIERRLSKLEAKQWVQIGLVALQLIATIAVFMRLG